MLVLPARDITLRSIILPMILARRTAAAAASPAVEMEGLQEPLLSDEDPAGNEAEQTTDDGRAGTTSTATNPSPSFWLRLSTSVVIFWSAGVLASLVSSIDVVWDLLGSSLSILLSYLIPAGTYLVITKQTDQPYTRRQYWSRFLCWVLLLVFSPLMIVSTGNAVVNTFFQRN
mmetsp:Transcript_24304/g.39695  ORF Transcript_24304/g.39695 Transcript_24304/m.39695 type:complete len:173 (+) Transcript_24304:1001-1519(+)